MLLLRLINILGNHCFKSVAVNYYSFLLLVNVYLDHGFGLNGVFRDIGFVYD